MLLRRLFEFGADVVPINVDPNGLNINHECGAYPKSMSEAVVHNGADIGIAFDGDADRLTISDEKETLMVISFSSFGYKTAREVN